MRALYQLLWLLPIASATLLAPGRAIATTLVTYSFTSTSAPFAATAVTSGISASNFAASPNVNNQTTVSLSTPAGLNYSTGQAAVATRGTATEANTVSNDYVTFTLTPTAANTALNLTNLSFDIAQGGGTGGTRFYDVRTSTDNYTNSLTLTKADGTDVPGPAPIPTVRPNWTNASIDLSGAAYQGLSSITFRVFLTLGSSQAVDLDDVSVTGSVTPEPGTSAALLFGGLAVLRRRKRKVGNLL